MKIALLLIAFGFTVALIFLAELLSELNKEKDLGKYEKFFKRIGCYFVIIVIVSLIMGIGYELGCRKDLKGIIECSQDKHPSLSNSKKLYEDTAKIIECKTIKAKTEQQKNDSAGYNIKKDKAIRDIIDCETPIILRKYQYENTVVCKLQYSKYRFTIMHDLKVPYEQKEKWNFLCADMDANKIMIDPSFRMANHRISAEAIDKLKAFCK